MTIRIDDEFRGLIPPLTEEERTQLLANVMRDGCLDPLKVWKEERILLDGHNRFEICEQQSLEFKTEYVSLPDRNAAKDWIIKNQLGRRNLKPEQMAYLRGKKYEVEKDRSSFHGNQHTKSGDDQNGQHQKGSATTRARVARETGVGEATIQRNAKFSQAVDAIADEGGEDAKKALLSGSVKMTSDAASAVGELTTKQIKAVARDIAEGNVKSVTEAIQHAAPKLMPSENEESNGEPKERGVGVIRGNEAIDCLKRIPKNDALRKRGFQLVSEWIERNS